MGKVTFEELESIKKRFMELDLDASGLVSGLHMNLLAHLRVFACKLYYIAQISSSKLRLHADVHVCMRILMCGHGDLLGW